MDLPWGGRLVRVPFKGAKVKVLLFPLDKRRLVLSTLEGLKEVAFVANCGVPEQLWGALERDTEGFFGRLWGHLGVAPEEIACLWTGADVERATVAAKRSGDLQVWAVATAGVKANAQRMGVDRASHREQGGRFFPLDTINLLLFTSARLSQGAMVRALITVTEAKTAVLQDLDVRSSYTPLQNQATGTGTDGVLLVSGDGPPLSSTGGHTLAGQFLAEATREVVVEAIRRQNGLRPDRGVLERLAERGITLQGMLDAAAKMYVPDPSLGDEEAVVAQIEHELLRAFEDPNVASLLLGAMALEDMASRGAIPSLRPDRYASDPVELLADELLGLQIAQYIGGTRAVFEFYRWDREKPGLIASLPPFLDDAIGGLLAGVMVKVCSPL